MTGGYFDDYRDETSRFFELVGKIEGTNLKPIRKFSDIEGIDYLIVGGAPEACKDYWNLLQVIIDKSPLMQIIFMNTPSNNENIKGRFRNRKNIKFLAVGETIKFKE